MGFTVGAAFDLLFAPSAGEGSPWDGLYEGYESRRWFRRPLGDQATSDGVLGDVADAEDILAEKIVSCIPAWRAAMKKAVALGEVSEGEGRGIEGANGPSPAAADASAPATGEAVPVEGAVADEREIQFNPLRHIPPRMPYDVFAIAAYLIEGAGVYHHLQPIKHPPFEDEAEAAGIRHLTILPSDRQKVLSTAKAWSGLDPVKFEASEFARDLTADIRWKGVEPLFESWWVVFGESADLDVFDQLEERPYRKAPIWWKHAWRLLAIADEAAKKTAFVFDRTKIIQTLSGERTDISWFEAEVMLEHAQRVPDISENPGTPREFADFTTLSIARQAVANVLPKVRTSAVGCTLRSLSHHLALLPPAGVVRGRWTPDYLAPDKDGGGMPTGMMNLLLVPLPYSLTASAFKKKSIEKVSGATTGLVAKFGYFEVDQQWITEDSARRHEIITFVEALIQAAQVQCPQINGLVFPELALDYETFDLVKEHIKKHLPAAELLISGTSSDEAGVKGNFVAVASFQEPDEDPTVERRVRQTVREKHHRWKLDRAQLKEYGLLGALSPQLSWWENIALQNRRVDFTVLRNESVFAAMICEDLARVDPCQQVIRAVGPNLVVALLMDAPQLAERWPARYATVLAEDPGCAVLTLTSRGLMTRQHRLGIFRSNGDDRVVGLWRDDRAAAPTKLKCPYDAQAVLLSILSEDAEDISLDGREDKAKAWRYVGDVPIRLPEAKDRFGHILGTEDLACW